MFKRNFGYGAMRTHASESDEDRPIFCINLYELDIAAVKIERRANAGKN